MKVLLRVYAESGIECLSKTCPHKRKCANHESAGDFRSEGGFTPLLSERNNEYICDSYDKPDTEFHRYGALDLFDLQNKGRQKFISQFPEWAGELPTFLEGGVSLHGYFTKDQLLKVIEIIQ